MASTYGERAHYIYGQDATRELGLDASNCDIMQ